MYYIVVVSAHYLHAVDQLSGKEQVQSHVLPKGVKSGHDQKTNIFFQSMHSQICKLLKETIKTRDLLAAIATNVCTI